jgi:hypothetical protein
MSLPRTVAEILREHVTLDVECIDRMYLNAYVPQLQYESWPRRAAPWRQPQQRLERGSVHDRWLLQSVERERQLRLPRRPLG